jgi:heme exporter protein C
MSKTDRAVPILLVIAMAMFGLAPFMIDRAPYESTMGLIQRIFYFHVPAALTAMATMTVCGIASAVYLRRRSETADHIALAAAEITVVLGLVTLVTGPLWARKAWGIWWDWDARLTSALVMWMIAVAYLTLRRFAGAGSEVLAGALGLFGAVLVPFIYKSVDYWNTLHPKTTVLRTLSWDMWQPMLFCLAGFIVLATALIIVRVRLESARTSLDRALLALED